MAEKKGSKSGSKPGPKGGTRTRHDKPITVGEPVEELPSRSHSSATREVLDAIVEQKGSWVPIDTGGRQPNSVQSMLGQAAKKAKIDITVSVRGGQVFAKAK